MKYFVRILLLFLFTTGCSIESDKTRTQIIGPTPAPPPVKPQEPVKPQPKPKPLYACKGTSQFSNIEIWWLKSTPVTEFNLESLEQCVNSTSDRLDMVVRYHAQGTTINVNGEVKTFWMALKAIDEFGIERLYYQYSHFFSRSSTCTQGQFISEDGHIIEIRMNEPVARKGLLLFDNEKMELYCPRT